jgi:hypothetical protein
MSANVSADARADVSTSTGRLGRSYRAELLRSANRSTAALALLCLALTLVAMRAAGPQARPPLWGLRNASIYTATLLMGRAAVMAAGDFTSGTIRPWLIAAPGRTGVGLGKLAASVTVALASCLTIGALAWPATAVLGTAAAPAAAAAATGGLALASTALTVFGHAVGLLTRSVPLALTLTLGWVLPGEALLEGTSPHADRWLPGTLLHAITLGHLPTGSTAAVAAAHAVLPFLMLEALALTVFARRDVNS